LVVTVWLVLENNASDRCSFGVRYNIRSWRVLVTRLWRLFEHPNSECSLLVCPVYRRLRTAQQRVLPRINGFPFCVSAFTMKERLPVTINSAVVGLSIIIITIIIIIVINALSICLTDQFTFSPRPLKIRFINDIIIRYNQNILHFTVLLTLNISL
jgi:hypothetical protein